MPYINLIQEHRDAARRNESRARGAFFLFVGLVAASVCGYGYLLLSAQGLKGQAAALQADIQKNAPLESQIARNKKLADEFAPRVQTLADAQVQSDRWGRILTHLSVQTPKPLWLTHLRCEQADTDKPLNLLLDGLTSEQSAVGEFMLRVQNSQDVDDVVLKYTQEKQSAHAHMVDFELSAAVSGTAVAKPKDSGQNGETKS